MFSLRDYIKIMDRMKKVGEELLDIDKESGGLLSSCWWWVVVLEGVMDLSIFHSLPPT